MFTSIVIPGLVGQPTQFTTVVPRIVTRRLVMILELPAAGERIVCFHQEREVEFVGTRSIDFVSERTVSFTGVGLRRVEFIETSERRVVFPPEEKCNA